MHAYRSHTCGQLRDTDAGTETRLSGWEHRVRDHGGVLFIDLRDHYGMTQVVADPDSPAFKIAEKVRSEWVVRVDGKVRPRPPGTENTDNDHYFCVPKTSGASADLSNAFKTAATSLAQGTKLVELP